MGETVTQPGADDQPAGDPDATMPPAIAMQQRTPAPSGRGPLALLRFARKHRLLSAKYANLAVRYARRRWLTTAGHRWQTDGLVFLGRKLQIQVGRGASLRLGRFVWVGDGTKIRCHEGTVEIGAKTVLGQECTISAFQRIRIGDQCIIADRVMFIDFDHGIVDVELPIRHQGIYKRDVEIGNNVWIGYGACILRGVRVGDNAAIGTNAVVTHDVPANAVVGGIPARVLRMRDTPSSLRWENPVEP
ncbi:MAG: acyltransferase [Solirubrobacterales bacterium]